MRIRAVSPPGVSFQDCFLVQLRQPLATSLPRQLLPSLTPVMDTPPYFDAFEDGLCPCRVLSWWHFVNTMPKTRVLDKLQSKEKRHAD